MLLSGVDGAIMESMYLMGWVSINLSGKVGRRFQDTRFEEGDHSKINFWHIV
jgi:hypothetical protein